MPGAGGAGGSSPPDDGRFTVGPPLGGLVDPIGGVDLGGIDGLITWAVPSLVLSVPGLLLMLAILAQTMGGAVWLPVIRRWLGGFGLRRRGPSGIGATSA